MKTKEQNFRLYIFYLPRYLTVIMRICWQEKGKDLLWQEKKERGNGRNNQGDRRKGKGGRKREHNYRGKHLTGGGY